MNYFEKPISEWSDNAISKFFKKAAGMSIANHILAFIQVIAAISICAVFSNRCIFNVDRGTYVETLFFAGFCVSLLMIALRTAYFVLLSFRAKTKALWNTSIAVEVTGFVLTIAIFACLYHVFIRDFSAGTVSYVMTTAAWFAAPFVLLYAAEIILAVFSRKYEFMKAEITAEADIRGKAHLETLDEKSVRKLYRKARNKKFSEVAGKVLFSIFPILFAVSAMCKIEVFNKIYAWVFAASMACIICSVLEMIEGFFFKRKENFQLPISCSVFRSFMNGK